ncbi:hypothetical protein B0H10DRAFT_1113840 [Mycena sp. CBHHK59/15]|nr:hypothetical protein B0H10DRAFT_1113840 [Mycena sp. CBHHK59/15]
MATSKSRAFRRKKKWTRVTTLLLVWLCLAKPSAPTVRAVLPTLVSGRLLLRYCATNTRREVLSNPQHLPCSDFHIRGRPCRGEATRVSPRSIVFPSTFRTTISSSE